MVVNPVSGSGNKKAMIGWDGEVFFDKVRVSSCANELPRVHVIFD